MKMVNARIILLLTSVLFLGSTCNEKQTCHKTILIVNNSDKDIYVQGETHYPDTLYFGHYSGLTSNPDIYKILAKSEGSRPLQKRDCLEDVFNYGVEIPSGVLMVYVFDAEVLETVPWSTVVNDYMVLKRYDLSLADLQRMNWTIIYQ
jgi:hypothetical protein